MMVRLFLLEGIFFLIFVCPLVIWDENKATNCFVKLTSKGATVCTDFVKEAHMHNNEIENTFYHLMSVFSPRSTVPRSSSKE